jgi:stearoyl-CoA desaturase (delta-9 desaturase)
MANLVRVRKFKEEKPDDHIASPVKEDVPKESLFVSTNGKTEINWYHTSLLLLTPALALYGCFTVTPKLPTIILAIIMYFWTGLGITGGYHRLWSHRAYSARFPVRLLLCLGGAAAFEGSAKWWCRNHRAHHRYTDTDKDPYNARKGFWYAHLGWMLVKQDASQVGHADIKDLQRDPMISWQHKNYLLIALSVGIAFPTLLAALWGDAWGGYFYACMLRVVFVHHATFFVNSLAHTFGEKSFSDHHTAFDSVLTAVLTLGEGYHNYHHEFPQDYRNGIRFFHYDPTKWLIRSLSFFKLTYNLKEVGTEEVEKARLQMQERKVKLESAKLNYGRTFEELPSISWEEIHKRNDQAGKGGECLVVIDSYVHDVKDFVHEHPGGRQTLMQYVGTDATVLFNGQDPKAEHKHNHTKEARVYLNAMRVGYLKLHDKGA